MDKNPARTKSGRQRRPALAFDTAGSVVVETAILLPIMIMLVVGIVSFGIWFMTAHGVQEAANEAARAAVGGLNDTERQQLASSGASAAIAVASGVDAARVVTTAARSGAYYTVTVTYTPADPNWLTYGLLPMRVTSIVRRSTVRLNTL